MHAQHNSVPNGEFALVRSRKGSSPRVGHAGTPRRLFARAKWLALMIPAFGFGATSASVANDDAPQLVQSLAVEVDYQVDEAALPLERVQLWYTSDGGTTWRDAGYDEDRQSPALFRAPADGTYGVYILAGNVAGRSGSAPKEGTVPHAVFLVDSADPVAQLEPPRVVQDAGVPLVLIRWTAVDAQLLPRPIELAYRRPPASDWVNVTAEPLANTGRFDWRVPLDWTGPVELRMTVRDRAGRVTTTPGLSFDIPRPAPTASHVALGSETSSVPARRADADLSPHVARGKDQAAKLLIQAMALREQGRDREQLARLREAVRLDPGLTSAFIEMGDALSRLGEGDRALDAYRIALQQQPSGRPALLGAARLHSQRREYPASAELLRTILRYNPADAEVWMHLGDVSVYRGDEVSARECYQRAATIDPAATKVIEDARKRLAILSEANRAAPTKSR